MIRFVAAAAVVALVACQPLPANSWVVQQPVSPAPVTAPAGPPAGVIAIAAPPPRTLENTYGPDHRQLVVTAQYPWSAVGKLSTGCTATLIDDRLIVTASHCFFDEQGRWKANDVYFWPNYIEGRASARARIQFVWTGSLTPFASTDTLREDWAIALIDAPLGMQFGSVSILDYLAVPGDAVTLTGYSIDTRGGDTATTHVDCHVRGYVVGQLSHDCDMTRGASGGPMWLWRGNVPSIVGIVSQEMTDNGNEHLVGYDSGHPNGAVASTEIYETAKWAVATY